MLSTLFWWLAIAAYAAYVRRPSRSRYAPLAPRFAAGLMAEADARDAAVDAAPARCVASQTALPERGLSALIREKLPLVAMSAISTAVTFAAQQQSAPW